MISFSSAGGNPTFNRAFWEILPNGSRIFLPPHLAPDPPWVSLLLVGHGFALRDAGLAELRAVFQHSRRMGL